MKSVRFGKVFLFSLIISFALILAVYEYMYLSKVGKTINLYDTNVPEIALKAAKCTSPYIESEVISIFKENDPYFKYIDLKSIDSIRVQNRETVSTDEQGLMNICSGTISVKSDLTGFKPLIFNSDNLFYKQVYFNELNSSITKYTVYEIPVYFSSQIIYDKNYVEIKDFNTGEFKCENECKTISTKENNIEKLIMNEVKEKVNKQKKRKQKIETKQIIKKEKEKEEKVQNIETKEKPKKKWILKLFKWRKNKE